MNNTIIKKGNDFEVLNPHKANAAAIAEEAIKNAQAGPVLIMKMPSGMTAEALAELKKDLQDQLSKGGPLHFDGDAPVEFLEVNQEPDPAAVFDMMYGRPARLEEKERFEKLYFGNWDHEDQSPAERIADKVGKRHAAEKKWILQEDQRRERIAQLMKDDAIKKLEETQPGTLPNLTGPLTYNGKPIEVLKETDIFAPLLKQDQKNPRTSQGAPGSTNATPRDNDSAKAIKGDKPRENRGPNSKKFLK